MFPTAASIPTRFFSAGTEVRQNRMEVHKKTRTFASLRQTREEFKSAKISFSISSMTLVMIFFFKSEQRMQFVVLLKLFNASNIAAKWMICVVWHTICVIYRMLQDFARNRSSGNQG